jgi:hypothetical protein
MVAVGWIVWVLCPVLIVAGWRGSLCQVLKRFLASVGAGFVGFGWDWGLDRVVLRGRRGALGAEAIIQAASPAASLRPAAAWAQLSRR